MRTYHHQEAVTAAFLAMGAVSETSILDAAQNEFYDGDLCKFIDESIVPLAKVVEQIYTGHLLGETLTSNWLIDVVLPTGKWFTTEIANAYMPSPDEVTETILALAYGLETA